jgi:hypothetical protein
MNSMVTYARPRPGPLPRGEGELSASFLSRDYSRYSEALCCKHAKRSDCLRHVRILVQRRFLPPLLSAFAFGFGAIASKRSEDGEERAGARADIIF